MKSQQWRTLEAHPCVGISLIQDKRGNYTGVQFKLVTGSVLYSFSRPQRLHVPITFSVC